MERLPHLPDWPSAAPLPTARAATLAILVALLILRLTFAAITPVGPDETYYLLWAKNPALGYYDHPPMVAWWMAGPVAILGDGAFAIRVTTVVAVIATSGVIYAAGRLLFGERTALRGALWTNATILLGVGIVATPDAPSVFFWAAATFGLAGLYASGDGRWWLVVGFFAGLGILSKLTNLFLGLGIVLWLIFDRDARQWWRSVWLWLGGLVAGLTTLPMVLWNIDNNYITFTKQFSRIGSGDFSPLKLLEFLVVHPNLLNPLITVFVVTGFIAWIRRDNARLPEGATLIVWTVMPLLIYMTTQASTQSIQGNWLAPVLPSLALLAAAAADRDPAWQFERLRAAVVPVGVGVSLVALSVGALPAGTVAFRYDVGQVLRGWSEMADDVEALVDEFDATWVAASHYAVAAELDYHLETPVILVDQRERHAFADEPDPLQLTQPGILVTNLGAVSSQCYGDARSVGAIRRMTGDEIAQSFSAFLVTDVHPELFALGCDKLLASE